MTCLNSTAWALLAGGVFASAVAARQPPSPDPLVTVTDVNLTVQVGDRITVGGPGSINFVPNATFKVYVVPHRPWKEDDPLVDHAVATSLVRSDSGGTILKSTVWTATRTGRFDVLVDYNDDGRFCSAFDVATGVLVRAK